VDGKKPVTILTDTFRGAVRVRRFRMPTLCVCVLALCVRAPFLVIYAWMPVCACLSLCLRLSKRS
jgi:hypothetical protein